MELMVSTCPNLRKMNLVVHYKTTVVEVLTYSLLMTNILFILPPGWPHLGVELPAEAAAPRRAGPGHHEAGEHQEVS